MEENFSNWAGVSALLVGVLMLGTAVLWLSLVVVRLRVEALINRRVIASLQRTRPAAEARSNWQRSIDLICLLLLGAGALVILLILYRVAV